MGDCPRIENGRLIPCPETPASTCTPRIVERDGRRVLIPCPDEATDSNPAATSNSTPTANPSTTSTPESSTPRFPTFDLSYRLLTRMPLSLTGEESISMINSRFARSGNIFLEDANIGFRLRLHEHIRAQLSLGFRSPRPNDDSNFDVRVGQAFAEANFGDDNIRFLVSFGLRDPWEPYEHR